MIIEKKAWPIWFQPLIEGKKNFEFRLADWTCQEGDTLLLREWDPKTKKYTGREVSKKVKYLYKSKIDELPWTKEEIEKYGFIIISIE